MTPVALIFDVGKTNKKLLLFDEQYQTCWEESIQLPETVDEDGFPCEDIALLTQWLKQSAARIRSDPRWDVRVINFSAYGASFVHLDREGRVMMPLYNYLKPYPPGILDQFYQTHGGHKTLSLQTASPLNDSLCSGLQLYRLKYERPEAYHEITLSLHLPQYLSYVLGGRPAADITSTGCHTGLWDFTSNTYHAWVFREGLDTKLPPILPSDTVENKLGIGLHDSSAALIPFLRAANAPFLQISTGTWSISLNPFNHTPLTPEELQQDCLCYLTYEGRPVKASRLMLGRMHDVMARGLNETAYLDLMKDLVQQQVRSTNLVLKDSPVKEILVDGGFSKNPIFMELLAQAFPELQVRAATTAQASALGAAMCVHGAWNNAAPAGLNES
jgi:sugar (pentulose or hexulose) kinase